MTSNTIDAVVFDFDGVFIDSYDCIYKAHNYMKEKLGLPPFLAINEFADIFSVNFTRGYERMGIKRADWGRATDLVQEYLTENYHETGCFAGMVDVAKKLEQKIAIASSGMSCIIEEKLKQIGLFEKVGFVAGRDKIANIKPDPEPLLMCMEKLGVKPEHTAYVGDTTVDIEAGKRAKVAKVIAATWGFDSVETLAAAKPDIIINSPSELRLFL